MESNVEEALRAKAFAEKHFMEKDFVGANNYAIRAQMLCPGLEGIAQMVATFAVYIASEAKINGELDFYSILGLDPSADKSKLKRHYKKMVGLLHPDKNKTVGADGAFRVVSDAWMVLSDNVKRSSYDQRRNSFAGYTAGSACYDNNYKLLPSHSRSDTFWTVCTSCHVQYEYLRKYVNKRLSCKNCRGVFIAVETGLAPVNGSFPFCTTTYSYGTENVQTGHGRGVTYVPQASGICPPNGASGHRTGHTTEYVSNISFQSNAIGNSVGVVDTNGLSSSSFVFYQANGDSNKTKPDKEFTKVKASSNMGANGHVSSSEVLKPKRGRPSAKKRKLSPEILRINGPENTQDIVVETKKASLNGTLQPATKLSSPTETSGRRWSAAPAFDTRQFLINRARSEIGLKMKDLKLVSEVAAKETVKRKTCANVDKSVDVAKISSVSQPELKRSVSMAISVPDSDFHDFDQDRTEECFKPKQIWALYDEEDGMPRLYCLIREVTSLNPFKIFISYLSSRSDTEFGSVNWLDSGFTKSCGSFRVFHSETVDQVNIFSHLLSREKTGRGGCVRIYPRSSDIWAVYRNWSPDWDRTTPDEVRHRYEMVEILEDYSEENGVWVTPLIKLDGFKTVYRRNMDKKSVRWITRREMLCFSHQVPACPLKGEGTNLPDGCWDLDPAATPDDLLQRVTEIPNINDPAVTPDDLLQNVTEIPNINDPAATLNELPNINDPAATLDELPQKENGIPNINEPAAILDLDELPQKENEIPNIPDLDATPDDICQEENEFPNNSSPPQMHCESEPNAEYEENVIQRQTFGSMSSFAAIEALFMDEGMFMDMDMDMDMDVDPTVSQD